MLCKSEVTAVLQRCSTAYHVAKSGFDSCILSFLCKKMAETDILLSGTIDFILQCAIYCLPDVIIKYVRCKKNPMAAWDFFNS